MRIYTFAVAFLALATVIFGCTRKAEEGGSVGSLPAPVYRSFVNPSIQPSEAIVLVNGEAITKADFDGWMDIRSRVYAVSQKLDPVRRHKKVAKYNARTRDLALMDLVRRMAIRQVAEKRGIVVPEAAVKASERAFEKGVHCAKGGLKSFAKTLPAGEAELLDRMILSDARDDYFLSQWATNDFRKVSDEEVSNRLAVVSNYNANVARMNDEAKAKAAAAKAEILSGASFASVTTNRAEIFKEQGAYYDTVELGELDTDEPLFLFLTTAEAGDISDPIDFDDGIGIVGVVVKELGEVPEGVTPAMEYTLVRCMFNGYEELDEPEDPVKMRELLLERKLAEAREGFVREMLKDVKVEQPFGKKLFAQPKKKKPARAKALKTKKAKR